MRNLAALFVCVVGIAVYFGAQVPPRNPELVTASPVATSKPSIEEPAPEGKWGQWAPYSAPDRSFELRLPGTPALNGDVVKGSLGVKYFHVNCCKPGEAVKVGWRRRKSTTPPDTFQAFGDFKKISESSVYPGIRGIGYQLVGTANWSILEGVGKDDAFRYHGLVLAHTEGRTFFLLLSTKEIIDLKNDFPKLRDSFRIKDPR